MGRSLIINENRGAYTVKISFQSKPKRSFTAVIDTGAYVTAVPSVILSNLYPSYTEFLVSNLKNRFDVRLNAAHGKPVNNMAALLRYMNIGNLSIDRLNCVVTLSSSSLILLGMDFITSFDSVIISNGIMNMYEFNESEYENNLIRYYGNATPYELNALYTDPIGSLLSAGDKM